MRMTSSATENDSIIPDTRTIWTVGSSGKGWPARANAMRAGPAAAISRKRTGTRLLSDMKRTHCSSVASRNSMSAASSEAGIPPVHIRSSSSITAVAIKGGTSPDKPLPRSVPAFLRKRPDSHIIRKIPAKA